MAKKNEFPSVLAFERKINPSDGFLYSTKWNDREKYTPLMLIEKSVRGTISNRLKDAAAGDPLKLNSEVEKPNLQTIDFCALPQECDTLKMIFTVKILGRVGEPASCNVVNFKNSLKSAVENYRKTYGFTELGKRYAINIANARFLWRNRVGAEAIEVHVKVLGTDRCWIFNGKNFPIRNFDCNDEKVISLGNLIAETLSGTESKTLEIVTYAKVEKGQEIFPSEELVLDKGKSTIKSKILYAVDGTAAMHSQKIGNALRTIDTWYPDYTDPTNSAGPIAAEPYGAVTNMGKAFRTPTEKMDFYSLFDKFACGSPLDNDNDMHYVMSVLIRGGVFGKGDKE